MLMPMIRRPAVSLSALLLALVLLAPGLPPSVASSSSPPYVQAASAPTRSPSNPTTFQAPTALADPGDENWAAGFHVPGLENQVRAFTVDSNGSLYIGGTFKTAGGLAANYIARWDGTAWYTLATGLDGPVWALAAHGDTIYAAGQFSWQAGFS